MISLREDQNEAVSGLREALRDHQFVMLQAATGFGKTFVAAYMAMGAQAKMKRVIFGVPRRELAIQTAKTFERFGIETGFISSRMPANPKALVQIATAGTLANRPELLGCDLFVPDEAHLWGSGERHALLEQVKKQGSRAVGLSATPQRHDGRPLSIFDAMVHGPSPTWLMERGHLSGYLPLAPKTPDLRGLHTRAGDYIISELDERFNKASVIGDAVDAYKKHAAGKRMIGFAFSREHGKNITRQFCEAGIQAEWMDGESAHEERRLSIEKFADGRALVLMNCQLCIEGFDLSAYAGRDVPIEAGGFYNPTQSLPRALQMMGRTLRPKAGLAIMLDHANLFRDHGFPDDEREWSLQGRPKRKKTDAEKEISMRICGECFAANRGAPMSCVYCGFTWPIKSRKPKQEAGELVEAVRGERKPVTHAEMGEARSMQELVRLGQSRGMKNAGWWALKVMGARRRS